MPALPQDSDPAAGVGRPSDFNNPHKDDQISTGGEAGIIIGVIIFLGIITFLGWFVYTRYRARKLGIPPQSLNPFADSNRISGARSGGIFGWVRDKVGAVSRKRTAGGAYEGDSLGGGGFGGSSNRRSGRSRAFGGLDPDEAWDARVGTEADGYGYEEQELSLRGQPAHNDEEIGYGGSRYGRLDGANANDGRGRNELDARYDQEMGRGGGTRNPFDDAEPSNMSLREVSPIRHSGDSAGPARKSAFREDI